MKHTRLNDVVLFLIGILMLFVLNGCFSQGECHQCYSTHPMFENSSLVFCEDTGGINDNTLEGYNQIYNTEFKNIDEAIDHLISLGGYCDY